MHESTGAVLHTDGRAAVPSYDQYMNSAAMDASDSVKYFVLEQQWNFDDEVLDYMTICMLNIWLIM